MGRYGEHYCTFSLQPNECKTCYCELPNKCSQLTFLKTSCILDLERWFATKLHNSKSVWSVCMKFSGLASRDMKNIFGKLHCKQTSTRKVIALVFEWRIYASFRTLCVWTYVAYMRHSDPKVLKSNTKLLTVKPFAKEQKWQFCSSEISLVILLWWKLHHEIKIWKGGKWNDVCGILRLLQYLPVLKN